MPRRNLKPNVDRDDPATTRNDESADDEQRRADRPLGVVGGNPDTPRALLARQLADAIATLTAAGDLEGARVAHDALGRLLGSSAEGAAVVDLARKKRERGQ